MTTPSKKTYEIYFEVNINNINQICKKNTNSKRFSGYDLGDSTFSQGNGCSSCPETSSSDPSYPITGSYTGQPFSSNFEQSQSKGSLSFTDFPLPSGSFNRGWSDYSGKDTINYLCPECGGYPTIMFTASNQYSGGMYIDKTVSEETCSTGTSKEYTGSEVVEGSDFSYVNYPFSENSVNNDTNDGSNPASNTISIPF